jgi:hypothetical protein
MQPGSNTGPCWSRPGAARPVRGNQPGPAGRVLSSLLRRAACTPAFQTAGRAVLSGTGHRPQAVLAITPFSPRLVRQRQALHWERSGRFRAADICEARLRRRERISQIYAASWCPTLPICAPGCVNRWQALAAAAGRASAPTRSVASISPGPAAAWSWMGPGSSGIIGRRGRGDGPSGDTSQHRCLVVAAGSPPVLAARMSAVIGCAGLC